MPGSGILAFLLCKTTRSASGSKKGRVNVSLFKVFCKRGTVEDKAAAREKAAAVISKLREMKLKEAVKKGLCQYFCAK